MAVFKCKTRSSSGEVVETRVTADKCNYFPNTYLLGSYAQFYQDGYQVGTVYRLVAEPVEVKEKEPSR